MAEYWKSTPKYWCKFCKVFVKDTKFEKQQHDATGRHQGNIQRSLRELHKGQEREERGQQRAKDEVARLNGIVAGSGSASSSGRKPAPAPPLRVATIEDRKRQMAQLAEMGIQVPDAFQKEMAMPGEWRAVEKPVKQKHLDANGQPLNKGVHKRKLEDDEEDLEAANAITKKKAWGSSYKTFPGSKGGDEDLDALFQTKKPAVKKEEMTATGSEVKSEDKAEEGVKQESGVKGESPEATLQDIPTAAEASTTKTIKAEDDAAMPLKTEEAAPVPAVVFKKRKKAGR